MAESLSSERQGSNGPDRAGFLDFVERHGDIESELLEAQETVRSIRRRRKDLRKLIAGEGHNIDEFDRALRDADRSGEEREAADRAYRRNMEWLGKPVGYQTSFDLAGAAPAPIQWGVRDLKRVDREGFDAGKAGERADRNSYSPGTEPFARWHSAWLRGQAEKVTDEIKPPDAAGPKRRGRPPGSKNRPPEAAPPTNGAAPAPNGSDDEAALDERLHALAERLDEQIPKHAVSIIGAAEALSVDEAAIEASLARLVVAGKLQRGANGIWYPPVPGSEPEPEPPMAA